MGCFWVVLIILVFLAIVISFRAWQRRKLQAAAVGAQGAPPANQGNGGNAAPPAMSASVRDLLGCYLVLLAIFLAYGIYRLLAVEFPDANTIASAQTAPPSNATVNATPTPTPAATPTPGTGTTGAPALSPTPIVPTITKVVPSMIDAYTQATVTVTGNNFSKESQVRINGDSYPTELTSTGELRASLDKGLSAGSGHVDVINGAAFSNSLPLQIVAYGKLYWCDQTFDIGPEARLLLLVLFAGALGSLIHALQSLVDFSGNLTLKASWTWWYVSRPFIGMALALVFYAALRGGMLAGTPAAVKDVNPYGVFTIAALAGMFSDKATQKLADIFDVLFKAEDNRKDPLKKMSIKTSSLPGGKVGQAYTPFHLEAADGTVPYVWTLTGLPQGLVLDPNMAIISGTPSGQTGSIPVKIDVKDAAGNTDTKTLNLVVSA
jgi:hypothetical protein